MSDTYTCKYCKKTFKGWGNNPADFGLHYDDKDIYGREFCCDRCNLLVTMTDRMIKNVIDSGYSAESLDRLEEQVGNICKRLRNEK